MIKSVTDIQTDKFIISAVFIGKFVAEKIQFCGSVWWVVSYFKICYHKNLLLGLVFAVNWVPWLAQVYFFEALTSDFLYYVCHLEVQKGTNHSKEIWLKEFGIRIPGGWKIVALVSKPTIQFKTKFPNWGLIFIEWCFINVWYTINE